MALFRKTFERLRNITRRVEDLAPLAGPVRKILREANRDRALRGVDFTGARYEPLAKSTLADRRRKGFPPGPPLARHGLQSRVIQGCEIAAIPGKGRLSISKSWPGVPWMEYHILGTPRMPRRDPLGFSTGELAQVRALLHKHIDLKVL